MADNRAFIQYWATQPSYLYAAAAAYWWDRRSPLGLRFVRLAPAVARAAEAAEAALR